MLPFWIPITISFIGLIIGSITDIQKREVPDFLNFSLISIGLVIGTINSIASMSWSPLFSSAIGLGIGYMVAAALFYTGQWGGGDAKMLMGLGAIHGVALEIAWPYLGSIIVSILFIGGIYSMMYFIGIIIVKWNKVIKAMQTKHWKKLRLIALTTLSLFIILSIIIKEPIIGLLGVIFAGSIIILHTAKIVQDKIMTKSQSTSKLVPGDWLVEPVKLSKEKTIEQTKIGLTEKQIQQIQQSKVKHILIKDGIPFIPGFFLGYLSIIIFGDWVHAGLLMIRTYLGL